MNDYQKKLANWKLAKMRNRGEASQAWHDAGNKITMLNISEFRAAMKKADKEFEANNPKP